MHSASILKGRCLARVLGCAAVFVRVCAIGKLYINLIPFPDSSNYCAASNNNKTFLFKFSSQDIFSFYLLSRQLILVSRQGRL